MYAMLKTVDYFVIMTISCLLLGFSNSWPTDRYTRQDILELETIPNTSNDTLVFAQVIFRHGQRNIVKRYPNDPYRDENYWPEGFGELTKEGKIKSYELGQYMKRRYDKLLGDNYSPKKVYIQSTDVNRCLCSAEALLCGLFPPAENEKWNEKIFWQPIPIHTTKEYQDHILATKKYCPKYQVALENYKKNSPEVQRIYKEYAELFLQWSNMAGQNISTTDDAYYLYSTISIEKEQNKTLPDWVEKSIEGPMEYITKFNFKLGTNSVELARLKYGFLIKELLEHFSRKINGTLKPHNSLLLWLYSAHDFTISGVLNSFGLFEPHILNYSCSLHLELYKTDRNEHYIQIFYRKSEEEHPVPLTIPGCGTKCPLKKIYELYSKIIPNSFNSECY